MLLKQNGMTVERTEEVTVLECIRDILHGQHKLAGSVSHGERLLLAGSGTGIQHSGTRILIALSKFGIGLILAYALHGCIGQRSFDATFLRDSLALLLRSAVHMQSPETKIREVPNTKCAFSGR